jgi:cytoskeletal protein CcmA (bactofilin family)
VLFGVVVDIAVTRPYNFSSQTISKEKPMTFEEKNNPPPADLDRTARLGPTLAFQGELTGQEDLVLQGKFQGKLNLPGSNLLVAEQGKIEAEIRIKNVTIRGEVAGNIHASGRVVIEKTGRMKGDLDASRISIEDGAQFKGTVKILSKR